ncbi:MAG: capsid protein [Lachnospiraceae bacterium]
MATLVYTDIFRNVLVNLYAQEQTSVDLYHSNQGIQIVNGKNLKIPKLTVSGYKDHVRGSLGFNTGNYSNDYEIKTLDHDRDVEFVIDPMDVDETNLVASIANIQSRFDTTQAIPEADCYTYSKIYTEASRVGATIKTAALTAANVLADFDANLEAMEEAGVPLDRVILYCTPAYRTLLKNAEGITRQLNVDRFATGIDRRVYSLDDIKKIITVPSARFKTAYDFTNGCVAASGAKQIDYILIDPEAQVSRDKYAYIHVFTPGTDSRTSDNYLYQNRKYNGTFAIDQLMEQGCIIHTAV